MEGRSTKGNQGLKKIGLFLGLVILILLTILLLTNRDRLTFGHFVRGIQYHNLGSAGRAEEFRFANLISNTFAVFGDGIAVASGSGLAVYDQRADQVYAALSPLERPVIQTAGDFVIAYDLGGLAIQAGNTREHLRHLEADGQIIAAHINENGWITVSSERVGTLGVVRVYDPEGRPRFHVRAGVGHLITAALAADNRTLVFLTMTETGGRVVWYYIDVESEDPAYEYLEEGEIFFDLWFTGRDGSVGAISSNMVRFLSNRGEREGEYRFSDRHLRAYDTNQGNIALHLSPRPAGAGGVLVLLEPDGTAEEVPAEGTVLDISLRDRYLAALSHDQLMVYRGNYVYARWTETEGMTRVLMREDGTVFRLSSQRAKLLVP